MVVSFTISKHGKRYAHGQLPKNEDNQVDAGTSSCSPVDHEQPTENETRGNIVEVGDKVIDQSAVLVNPEPRVDQVTEDHEVSFAINLFPDGFLVGDAAEVLDDIPNMLRPYDREFKKLLSAIEYGYIPRDCFDDLPCKFINGTLLCEIRDFRDCLDRTGDGTTPLVRKSPILHKAVLKMSMEKVIKDISSISDGTWTYKARLEFESRIIKVMHPDLCLNPKPVEDIFSGKFMTKMLNLEFPWSSRKRKLIDTEETSSLQRLEIHDEGSDMLPEQHIINHTSNPGEPGTSVPVEEGRCEQQTERLIFKKHKEEPLELSREPLSCMIFKTILAPETQQKEKQLLQSCDSEKFNRENQYSLEIRDGHQENFQVLPQLQDRVLVYPVKQESESTPGSAIGYNNRKSKMHPSSLVSKTVNVPSNSIQLNDVVMHVEQNLTNAAAQERISLQEPLTSAAVGSASVNANFGYIDSLLRYSPVLGKRKLNSNLQSLGMNIVESLQSTRDMKAASTSSSPAGNSSSPWPFETKDDPILERFSKIKMVTQRYGLHERKKKADNLLDRKPFFSTPFQVAYNLMSENNDLKVPREDVSQTRTLNFLHPSHFVEGSEASVLVVETQTKLVLSENLEDGTVEGRVMYGRGEEGDSSEFPLETNFVSTHKIDKLAAQFVSQMAREGFILAGDKLESSLGGNEQGFTSQRRANASSCAASAAGTVILPSPATIPRKSTPCMPSTSTRSMQTPYPKPLTSEDVLTGGHLQQPSANISSVSATGRNEPLISNQIPGQSPYMFSSEISSMPVFHHRQFPSQDFLAGANLIPSGNFLSALQPSANYSSSPLLNNAAQVSHFELQWQQIIESLVRLQFQMQEREHQQQQQLIHRHIILRGLPTASDYLSMRQLGVGSQGSPNPYLGYLSNMDTGGPSSVKFGQVNYLGSNILDFKGNNLALGGISDPPDPADLAGMIEQSQHRPVPIGVPFQSNNIGRPLTYGMARQPPIIRTNHDLIALHPPLLPDHVSHNMLQVSHRNAGNAGIVPMHPAVVPGMVHNFSYQQSPPAQIQVQLQQQYQRINFPFQGQDSLEGRGHQLPINRQLPMNPNPRVNPQLQVYQHPGLGMNPQPQVEAAANTDNAPEIMDLSFPQVGSAVGSNETSAMVSSDDESGDVNSDVNTGGVRG